MRVGGTDPLPTTARSVSGKKLRNISSSALWYLPLYITHKKRHVTVTPPQIASTQKIHLQERYCTSMPPKTGPNAGPMRATPWNRPMNLPRSPGVAMSPTVPEPVPIAGEPPVAWIARMIMRSQYFVSGVSAIPMHAATYMTRHRIRIGRRPSESDKPDKIDGAVAWNTLRDVNIQTVSFQPRHAQVYGEREIDVLGAPFEIDDYLR
jgi:hypothetical protein